MSLAIQPLPDDYDALRRFAADLQAELARKDIEITARDAEIHAKTLHIEKLKMQLTVLRRARFGRSSEKLDREIEQLELLIGELEEEQAEENARAGVADTELDDPADDQPSASPRARPGKRRAKFPEHLPRETVTHEPACTCPGCGSTIFSRVGQDGREVLEYTPASFKVIEHIRPKLSCRACETIVQAPMPSLPIERGLPRPGLLAHIAISKFCDHQPLHRQSEIYAREGIELDGADQPFGLPQGQSEHRSQRQGRRNGQRRVARLAALRRSGFSFPSRDGFLSEPDCQVAALPQGCIVGRRVRDPVTLLWDVVATLSIGFERHDITSRPVTGTAPAASYPGNAAWSVQQGQIALYFQDEARVGQKGRVCHRWWLRGQRPPGLHDNRFEYAYIFAAVEPATGNDFCLVLPSVSTHVMSVFLRGFSEQLAPDVHAVLVLDGAGWHVAAALQVPDNVTLVKLPPYAPELNPVERVWLYLRERFLSHRLHADQEAVMDAACKAWNRLTPKRLQSLCNYPWIKQVTL